MSRIGRAPITVPAGVEIKVDENNHITVKGPKGTVERTLVPQMKIEIDNGVLHVKRPDDSKENRSLHGLTRTLVDNMVVGVTQGFEKKLEINGVGSRAANAVVEMRRGDRYAQLLTERMQAPQQRHGIRAAGYRGDHPVARGKQFAAPGEELSLHCGAIRGQRRT